MMSSFSLQCLAVSLFLLLIILFYILCYLLPVNCSFFAVVVFFTVLGENTKGIPDFWLTIFKNVEMIAEMVQVGCRVTTSASNFH